MEFLPLKPLDWILAFLAFAALLIGIAAIGELNAPHHRPPMTDENSRTAIEWEATK